MGKEPELEPWLKDGREWLKKGKSHIQGAFLHPWEFIVSCLWALLSWNTLLILILCVFAYKTGEWITANENSKLTEANHTLEKNLTSLDGQLKEVKQDRDKYQMMLAPFQAMAVKLYTNTPVEDRLNLFSSQMFNISSNLSFEMERERPKFIIYVNDKLITNNSTISLEDTRELFITVKNLSPISASGLSVDFSIPVGISATNLLFGADWHQEPPTTDTIDNVITTNIIFYHWEWMAARVVAPYGGFQVSSIKFLTNTTYIATCAIIEVYAEHSEREILEITIKLK
jgi:hypothetical protein